ncbi:MAG: hypothetical protein KA754_05065 [Corallincola sp.]|nr:hypothetical protein [Corallincola sp.]
MTTKSKRYQGSEWLPVEIYEATVIDRALRRAGRNPMLKGHIHEIMACDKANLTGLAQGVKTQLTRSPTATTVDLVAMKAGKVVGRSQLKDCVSSSGVNGIVKRVSNNGFPATKLVGTKETANLVNPALAKAGSARTMQSSGISSDTTTRLAQRAGAAGSGTLQHAALASMRSGGAIGAIASATVEGVCALSRYADGECTGAEATASVAKAAVVGGVSGAAGAAASTVGGAAIASAVSTLGVSAGVATVATVAAPVVLAVAVSCGVVSLFNRIFR